MYQIIENFIGVLPSEYQFITPILFMLLVLLVIYILFIAVWGGK